MNDIFKSLVVDQIKERFKKEGINPKSLYCVFNIEYNTFIIHLCYTDKTEQTLNEFSKNDISTLKRIFITKVVKEFKKSNPEKSPEQVILLITLTESEKPFDVFVDCKNENQLYSIKF